MFNPCFQEFQVWPHAHAWGVIGVNDADYMTRGVDVDHRVFVRGRSAVVAHEEVHIARVDTLAPDLLQPAHDVAALVKDQDDQPRARDW